MRGFPADGCAVVIGASGGIGAALTRALVADGGFAAVVALSRRDVRPVAGALPGRIDLLDETGVAAAAARVAAIAPPRLVLVATGWLGTAPEKSWRALDADRLVEAFRRNAVGPALAMKHFLPLLPEGRAVFAALSARVGSIGDNRLGGWHGYRAAKAALNMLLRNGAIELARTRPDALCVGLHPGTVDTGLSRPFQRGVPEGRLFTPDFAAERLLAVIDGLRPADSGGVFAWDGAPVPP
ncbi:SDR family NAD(P)-dependent oxidoreductase [Roseomonas sp. NAR14]|uniref:SDR family NAD(P)-dependent oxidoreductase n=1 Tax=Roseomonas acroporae TaxID=2937791 RepID=A0A9X2C0H0_9PROT|nr:SDR family NAD(P)-dependent oxidoreductase [Roseomonas acroporae]MCK8788115.1 SDR family NAD(P)-dependent oxidoreductase [Roseomonas acroporae]